MKIEELINIKGEITDLIRLGSNYDGGYVVSKSAIEKSDVLYTYGVGDNYFFEKDFINRYSDKICRMFDHTIGQLNINEKNLKFYQDGLFVYEENTSFDKHIDMSIDQNKNIFLKIDTEGAEYDFFNLLKLESLKNVTGMVVEFHNLWDINFLKKFKNIIIKLNNLFDIVHVHGNNYTPLLNLNESFLFPSTPEISFIQKNIYCYTSINKRQYPLDGLDQPNNPNRSDYNFTL